MTSITKTSAPNINNTAYFTTGDGKNIKAEHLTAVEKALKNIDGELGDAYEKLITQQYGPYSQLTNEEKIELLKNLLSIPDASVEADIINKLADPGKHGTLTGDEFNFLLQNARTDGFGGLDFIKDLIENFPDSIHYEHQKYIINLSRLTTTTDLNNELNALNRNSNKDTHISNFNGQKSMDFGGATGKYYGVDTNQEAQNIIDSQILKTLEDELKSLGWGYYNIIDSAHYKNLSEKDKKDLLQTLIALPDQVEKKVLNGWPLTDSEFGTLWTAAQVVGGSENAGIDILKNMIKCFDSTRTSDFTDQSDFKSYFTAQQTRGVREGSQVYDATPGETGGATATGDKDKVLSKLDSALENKIKRGENLTAGEIKTLLNLVTTGTCSLADIKALMRQYPNAIPANTLHENFINHVIGITPESVQKNIITNFLSTELSDTQRKLLMQAFKDGNSETKETLINILKDTTKTETHLPAMLNAMKKQNSDQIDTNLADNIFKLYKRVSAATDTEKMEYFMGLMKYSKFISRTPTERNTIIGNMLNAKPIEWYNNASDLIKKYDGNDATTPNPQNQVTFTGGSSEATTGDSNKVLNALSSNTTLQNKIKSNKTNLTAPEIKTLLALVTTGACKLADIKALMSKHPNAIPTSTLHANFINHVIGITPESVQKNIITNFLSTQLSDTQRKLLMQAFKDGNSETKETLINILKDTTKTETHLPAMLNAIKNTNEDKINTDLADKIFKLYKRVSAATDTNKMEYFMALMKYSNFIDRTLTERNKIIGNMLKANPIEWYDNASDLIKRYDGNAGTTPDTANKVTSTGGTNTITLAEAIDRIDNLDSTLTTQKIRDAIKKGLVKGGIKEPTNEQINQLLSNTKFVDAIVNSRATDPIDYIKKLSFAMHKYPETMGMIINSLQSTPPAPYDAGDLLQTVDHIWNLFDNGKAQRTNAFIQAIQNAYENDAGKQAVRTLLSNVNEYAEEATDSTSQLPGLDKIMDAITQGGANEADRAKAIQALFGPNYATFINEFKNRPNDVDDSVWNKVFVNALVHHSHDQSTFSGRMKAIRQCLTAEDFRNALSDPNRLNRFLGLTTDQINKLFSIGSNKFNNGEDLRFRILDLDPEKARALIGMISTDETIGTGELNDEAITSILLHWPKETNGATEQWSNIIGDIIDKLSKSQDLREAFNHGRINHGNEDLRFRIFKLEASNQEDFAKWYNSINNGENRKAFANRFLTMGTEKQNTILTKLHSITDNKDRNRFQQAMERILNMKTSGGSYLDDNKIDTLLNAAMDGENINTWRLDAISRLDRSQIEEVTNGSKINWTGDANPPDDFGGFN